jgi:hypothetical protein
MYLPHVFDTGAKFAIRVVDTCVILPPVSLTPVASFFRGLGEDDSLKKPEAKIS